MGNYLDVTRAVDPSLILWENLGSSGIQRFFRAVFILIIAAFLLCVTLLINLYSAKKGNDLKASNPQI